MFYVKAQEITDLTKEDQKQACFTYTRNDLFTPLDVDYVHSNTGGICSHSGHCIN